MTTRSTSLRTIRDPQSTVFVPPVDADGIPILALRREPAATSISVSARKLDELTAGGLVPSVKLDGVRLYPVEGLARWLREHSKGGE